MAVKPTRTRKSPFVFTPTPLAGALTIAFGLAISVPQVLHATETGTIEAAASQSQTFDFNLPAQPLDDALAALGTVTGDHLIYDASLTNGLQSEALSGRLTRQQALNALLTPHDLGYQSTGPHTLTLQAWGSTEITDKSTLELAPVTIVGEKIARDSQQTTTSVAVLSAQQIEQARIQNLPDAFRMMANVRDADFLDSGYIIRGINSEGVGGPAGRPLSSLYIDGVAQTMQGARRGALGMWDVEQVEVLRGPQSTVSGRNALAGAIRIDSKDPTYHWESAARVTTGTLDTSGEALMLSGPLVEDKLAFRVTAEQSHADGGIDYPEYAGMPRLDERENDDYWQVRGKLLFTPQGEDGVRMLLSHSKSYDSPAYADVDGRSAGVDYFDREWGAQTLALFTEARSTINYNTALEITQPLTDGLSLTSLTTRVDTETSRPSVDLASRGKIDETEIAQELRLNWDYEQYSAVAGVYANQGKDDLQRSQQRPWEPFERRERSNSDINNYALFGEINWHLTDALTLISGLRYDYEQQDFESSSQRVNGGSILTSSSSEGSASYDAWLPKLGLLYQLTADQNVGFTLQRAYRGGGAATNFVTGEGYDYDPEYAWNYELSYRSQWADGKVRLNANLFYLDWEDQQVNVPQIPGDFTSDIIVNAGKSHVSGGELELSWLPIAGLETFASVGLAKTEFDEFSYLQNGQSLDMAGEPFPQSPEWNAAFGADYQHGSGWFVGGDAKYTGTTRSRSQLEGGPKDDMPSYTVLNLRTGYASDYWKLTLWANNVTDEEYFLYRYAEPGFEVATVGRERVVGTTLDLFY
jgi:outer membrane receptor protein involved in Fe transport